MTHIKRLVMKGFKSFVRQTDLIFTPGINVILGPNGSGKSNVSDALCFVLGRLSIKSMRAAKAKNLIYTPTVQGSAPPAKEASVEMVFDNSDKTFSYQEKEISIKRVVRKNGQSIYKINNQTKTRQEVLALLAQAGIDPNGFNIILQGEIQNLVRMQTEERRKIIEEVAGISIYESRRAKSLKELDKTEDKLKEVLSILRERTTYLNNLEKERQQALRFKKLEKDARIYQASVIYSDLSKKEKEAKELNEELFKKDKEIEKRKKNIEKISDNIESFNSKIKEINLTIQKSTGVEQEALNSEIANTRAELAGIYVKIENNEKKISEIGRQKQEIQENIRNDELTLKELSEETPSNDKKEKELETKKQELEKLEDQKKKFYLIKSKLRSIKEILKDKQSNLQSQENDSNILVKQIDSLSLELFDKRSDQNKLNLLKKNLKEKKDLLQDLNKREIEIEKIAHTDEHEIQNNKRLIQKVSKIDICPVCKSKITKDHIHSIEDETSSKINLLKEEIRNIDRELNDIYSKKDILNHEIKDISLEIEKRESDLIKFLSINEKKEQIKRLQEKIAKNKEEIVELEKENKKLEREFDEYSNIEQKYETVQVEVQEISLRSKNTINSEISFKQRELERSKIFFKQLLREEENINDELLDIKKTKQEKEVLLKKKKAQEEELEKRFQKLISRRDENSKKIRIEEADLMRRQHQIQDIEREINENKIEKARIDATVENLETEMLEFPNVKVVKMKREVLVQKLEKTKEILSRIGSSVNLRSLEVYDSIKEEYDKIKEKVEIISNEKEGILKIIHEIDLKKKRAFLKTLGDLNEIFSRNFSQLSVKGQVSLDIENKKSPFEAGVNILVKTGKGKYFDVTSLSGGEQTLVALALIFAIQELNPYCFYILDEIDAALDKRNSSRLAGLLKKYMQKGQYIVITHNDEVISNATNLYGVSMHDGISKVISLKL